MAKRLPRTASAPTPEIRSSASAALAGLLAMEFSCLCRSNGTSNHGLGRSWRSFCRPCEGPSDKGGALRCPVGGQCAARAVLGRLPQRGFWIGLSARPVHRLQRLTDREHAEGPIGPKAGCWWLYWGCQDAFADGRIGGRPTRGLQRKRRYSVDGFLFPSAPLWAPHSECEQHLVTAVQSVSMST
jgi:hypothetical protein